MPSFATKTYLPYTAEQMFALVADVERYPEFVPLCEGMTIRERTTDPQGLPVLIATMQVGFKHIQERFTSRVVLDAKAQSITVTYVDGPFRYLTNIWRFVPDKTGCDVHFHIDYEFRNRMLGFVMGTMFDRAFRKFTEAFRQRAESLYKKPVK